MCHTPANPGEKGSFGMVSALATVRNRSGLHMRPAQVFVRSVSKFPCEVTLRVGERLFNGKSILGLMTAGVRQSAQVEIRCSGEGEREALEAAL